MAASRTAKVGSDVKHPSLLTAMMPIRADIDAASTRLPQATRRIVSARVRTQVSRDSGVRPQDIQTRTGAAA